MALRVVIIICRRARAIESNPPIVQLPQHDRSTGGSVQHGFIRRESTPRPVLALWRGGQTLIVRPHEISIEPLQRRPCCRGRAVWTWLAWRLAHSSFWWLSSHAESLQQRDNVCWRGFRTLHGRNLLRAVSYRSLSIAPSFQLHTHLVLLSLRHGDRSAHCLFPALIATTPLIMNGLGPRVSMLLLRPTPRSG